MYEWALFRPSERIFFGKSSSFLILHSTSNMYTVVTLITVVGDRSEAVRVPRPTSSAHPTQPSHSPARFLHDDHRSLLGCGDDVVSCCHGNRILLCVVPGRREDPSKFDPRCPPDTPQSGPPPPPAAVRHGVYPGAGGGSPTGQRRQPHCGHGLASLSPQHIL